MANIDLSVCILATLSSSRPALNN